MKKLVLSTVCAITLFGATSSAATNLKKISKYAVGASLAYGGLRIFITHVLDAKKISYKVDLTALSAILVGSGLYLLSDMVKSDAPANLDIKSKSSCE